MKYGILLVSLLLVACGGATGQVVQDESVALQQQIQDLISDLEAQDSVIAQKDALVEDARALLADLEAEVAAKQTVIDQQKVVLKDMDNERLDALTEAERCEELEQKNEKLQDMLDICQEDLS